MRRRAILGYGAAGVGAVALMLFVGWWQVDGPEPVGQRPVALTEMDFRLTDHEGNAVGPETLIGRPTMVFHISYFSVSHIVPMSARPRSRTFRDGSTIWETRPTR